MADMKLKPCPVCASINVCIGDDYRSDPCVRCCACGLQTSGYNSAQEAIKVWNIRAESEEIKELRAAMEDFIKIAAIAKPNCGSKLRALIQSAQEKHLSVIAQAALNGESK